MRYELYHVTAHGAPSSLLQFDVIYIFHRRHGFQQGQSFPQKKRSKRTASKELPQNDARSLVRCSIEKFVYILQEFIPRMCVSHKCVKGCGDRRDINFACMGLQFASKRFVMVKVPCPPLCTIHLGRNILCGTYSLIFLLCMIKKANPKV